MGRSDFLKKIAIDLNSFTEAHSEVIWRRMHAIERMARLHNFSIEEIKKVDYDIRSLLKRVINNKEIAYSSFNFLVDMERFGKRTDLFKQIAFDLEKIKAFTDSKKIHQVTFTFIVLHFYASQFDMIINFLKPIAKKIQKHERYMFDIKKETKLIKVHNSKSVIEIFKRFHKGFYNHLNRMLDRDLRNAIAHDEYQAKEGFIHYKKKGNEKNKRMKASEKRIQRDKVVKNTIMIGMMINSLQTTEYHTRINVYEKVLEEKMTKKDIKKYLEIHKI